MKLALLISTALFTLQSYAFTLNGNYKNGWRGPTLRFNFNLTDCPPHILDAFDDAAELWNSVPTSYLKIERGALTSTVTPAQLVGGTATDVPVIVCDTNFGGTTGADEDSLAGVGTSAVTSGTYINYGGVVLNASAGKASILDMSRKQTAIVLAHEIGHTLGFGHSEDTAALMYFSLGYKKSLRLSQDDWDAMSYLYGQDQVNLDNLVACGSIANNMTPTGAWLIYILPLFLLIALRLRLVPRLASN